MKTYILPDAQIVLRTLKLACPSDIDVIQWFQPRFADAIGEQELEAHSIWMHYVRTIDALAKTRILGPFSLSILYLEFDRYARALFANDPEYLTEVLAWKRHVLTETRK